MQNRLVLAVVSIALCLLATGRCLAINPPMCPHVIGWNNEIDRWAQGATWIKVIFENDIPPAQATGAKVFYRPFTADTVYWENGYLPDQRTGSSYADLVWAKIANLAKKPDAVSYRNEFDWSNPTKAKRTCAEFVNYKNRLRQLGYAGQIVFGSFPPDWISAATWQDPDLMAAVNAADAVETHEYFDFEVNCCLPNRCFRHRDIAIANNSYLRGKPWFIGEFGSDVDWGPCKYCGDGLFRTGWRDRNKLSEQQYIDQMKIYRAGCANEVVAVFVFQQGDQTSWSNYEVIGTSVADYMKTTWEPETGRILGRVKKADGTGLGGATITATPGGYSTQAEPSGNYTFTVPVGTFTVSASAPGFATHGIADKTVVVNKAVTVNFNLHPIQPISVVKALADTRIGAISGCVVGVFPEGESVNSIYIEAQDRSAAICTAWPGAVSVDDEVNAVGRMETAANRERILTAATLTVTGRANSAITPLFISSRSLGSGAGAWRWIKGDDISARVWSDVAGLSNNGLLVKAAGVVSFAGADYFYLNDGSGFDDYEVPDASLGMPPGLRVSMENVGWVPPVGSFVSATGISSFYRSETQLFRLLRVRTEWDVTCFAW